MFETLISAGSSVRTEHHIPCLLGQWPICHDLVGLGASHIDIHRHRAVSGRNLLRISNSWRGLLLGCPTIVKEVGPDLQLGYRLAHACGKLDCHAID